jgi:hypothetical protein
MTRRYSPLLWQAERPAGNVSGQICRPEIAAGVKYTNARVLTISLSFATDDHVVPKELR